MKINTFAEILDTVVENGRVLAHDDGTFVTASLIAEVEFEAHERGLSPAEMSEAIAFATAHSSHHE